MRPALRIGSALLVAFLLLPGCANRLTMQAKDGERIEGRWRHAREGSGLIQVVNGDGEVLVGILTPTPRRAFFETYQTVFGLGTIASGNGDLSAYGHGFWMLPGTSNVLADVVYGENANSAVVLSVAGPLLYWTAYLEGDRRTFMRCFLIGSTQRSGGLGRCKGGGGKEYSVQF